jgi:hypothetical protein
MTQSGDGDWVINSTFLATALTQDGISFSELLKAFDLAGTSPPNQKPVLCALCDSVVKNLFWNRVNRVIIQFSRSSLARQAHQEQKIWIDMKRGSLP